jgi:capsular polysaccharide biosynthesis protein
LSVTVLGAIQILRARWFTTIAGLMFSLAVAGVAFSLVPPVYMSSGAAMLVQSRQPGLNPTNSSSNPLLNFDPSLNTTSSMLIKTISTADVATQVEASGDGSFTVKNVDVTATSPSEQPFIYVTSRSPTPDASVALVNRVLDMARQELVNQQRDLRVLPTRYIKLQSVVYPTKPKLVLGRPALVGGVALMVGIAITVAVALLRESSLARRGIAASPGAQNMPERIDPHVSANPIENGRQPLAASPASTSFAGNGAVSPS